MISCDLVFAELSRQDGHSWWIGPWVLPFLDPEMAFLADVPIEKKKQKTMTCVWHIIKHAKQLDTRIYHIHQYIHEYVHQYLVEEIVGKLDRYLV